MSTHPTFDGGRRTEGQATRIWRLQYGPCWCHSTPDQSSFDYVRLRRTAADFGSLEQNLLIVSERVIDGSAKVYSQVHASVPDPKLVISAGACPTAHQFWDELPNGWSPADEILPIDIRVQECVTGNPEALVAALLTHLFREGAGEPQVGDSGEKTLTLSSTGEPADA